MTDYNDETDPNDLLDLMKPGETLEQMRERLRKLYWRVNDDLVGASKEDALLHTKLHRYMPWLGGYGRGEPKGQVWPGPKKDTHKTQKLVRARWHNAEHTLIRIRTTDAHYIIGSDHPRWGEAKAMVNPYNGEPETVEIPDFLKAPEAPPADLADLFEVADTPAESNEKLLVRLREVLGLIGLAEDAGGRAAPELYRRKDRLESGIRWNRGRSAEAI